MARLVLGPLLRHVDETSATVWVETDESCTVTVLDASARTFQAGAHHYALVVLTGLAPGTSTPYRVVLDDEQVWPLAGMPDSRIRTLSAGDADAGPWRLVFGSCRKPPQPGLTRDALAAYAERMTGQQESEWPHALLLVGDQVYADETSPATQEWLRTRRDTEQAPDTEVADFEEYVHLYHESWSLPNMRWLMSTVPVSMIFDDHDVRDDWNTSQVWREQMARLPWWRERIRGALASYWIYQHIGNLSPEDLHNDPLWTEVSAASGDVAGLLRDFADRADAEEEGAKGTRWSYRRDFGRTRLLVIDTRSGRILAGGARAMVGEEEFAWIEDNAEGEVDHLLIGSSLPWLMPHVMHHIESWNEARCQQDARWAEKLRQAADLEHWPSFRASFDRLGRLVTRLAADGPATVSVLSGDVHHGYIARVRAPGTRLYQLTCSPTHNAMPAALKLVFRAAWYRPLAVMTRWLARRAGVPAPELYWAPIEGPYFGDQVATVELTGRDARTWFERTDEDGQLTAAPAVRL